MTVCNTSVARIVTVGRSHVGADGATPREGVGFTTTEVIPGGAGGEGPAAFVVAAGGWMGAVEAPGALTNRMVSTRITALGMLAVWLAVLSMFWKLLDSRRAVTEIVSAWLKTSTVKIRMAS